MLERPALGAADFNGDKAVHSAVEVALELPEEPVAGDWHGRLI